MRGLVAVAEATPGSIENLRLINSGQLESGFAQADLAGWAYSRGQCVRRNWPVAPAAGDRQPVSRSRPPRRPRRTARSTRSPTSPAKASRSASAARAALPTLPSCSRQPGLARVDVTRKISAAGTGCRGTQGWNARRLISGRRLPGAGDSRACRRGADPAGADRGEDRRRTEKGFRLLPSAPRFPAGGYPGVDSATPSLGFSALWLVNADVDPDLVYAITQALWHPATARLLAARDPIGNRIRLDRALDGLSVPLHPGAARFYREAGMPFDGVPEVAERENSRERRDQTQFGWQRK